MHCYPLPDTAQAPSKKGSGTETPRCVPPLLDSVLIANRGEIACRVIRTARRMGLRTIAVYSDADQDAQFVREADEAWRLGPAPVGESYLRADRILDIAKASQASAIHPGYGFLSENEAFAEACAAAGICFIGPPVAAIAAMGSKSAAKALMGEAGVPLVPGYHGDNQHPAYLQEQADRIGYPVLIKASAGGGGKGMRIVESASEFAAALASCQREALASFGDDQVLIEKYLQGPRHVEIQVFADQQGQCVFLFERDCSLQRRHQKVIEEAPAPHLAESVRQAMGEAACAAARAVGYVGAGTVEFIMDQRGEFFFMEMNTRLQVEHPVTEMITGLDLVEWQLRVASGHPLPLQQHQLKARGHAFEARIYAEDPARGFLPATGTLHYLGTPETGCHVRIDSGVVQGDTISPFYDPMIAKLIVWDETRAAALARMSQALAAFQVVGVTTNTDFLKRIVAHPEFAAGRVDTGLIARHQEALLAPDMPPELEELALIALAETLTSSSSGPDAWQQRTDWRLNGIKTSRMTLRHNEQAIALQLEHGRQLTVRQEGQSLVLSGHLDGNTLEATVDGHRYQAVFIRHGQRRVLFTATRRIDVDVDNPFAIAADSVHGETHLKAPMPGRVVTCCVDGGTRVTRGTPLMILEAMKMEHTLSAPADGVVKAFYFTAGEQVDDGADLIDFEAD